MGRIVVDSVSRHIGGLVVVRVLGREHADKKHPPSNPAMAAVIVTPFARPG
jgi:hypothetical protein